MVAGILEALFFRPEPEVYQRLTAALNATRVIHAVYCLHRNLAKISASHKVDLIRSTSEIAHHDFMLHVMC